MMETTLMKEVKGTMGSLLFKNGKFDEAKKILDKCNFVREYPFKDFDRVTAANRKLKQDFETIFLESCKYLNCEIVEYLLREKEVDVGCNPDLFSIVLGKFGSSSEEDYDEKTKRIEILKIILRHGYKLTSGDIMLAISMDDRVSLFLLHYNDERNNGFERNSSIEVDESMVYQAFFHSRKETFKYLSKKFPVKHLKGYTKTWYFGIDVELWQVAFEVSKLSYKDLKESSASLSSSNFIRICEAKETFLEEPNQDKIKKWVAINTDLLNILPCLQHTKLTKLSSTGFTSEKLSELLFTPELNNHVLVEERNKNLEIIVMMIHWRIDLSGQDGFKKEWITTINKYLSTFKKAEPKKARKNSCERWMKNKTRKKSKEKEQGKRARKKSKEKKEIKLTRKKKVAKNNKFIDFSFSLSIFDSTFLKSDLISLFFSV
jgi:hypothetical protein